jgi:hypothetical protein
LNKIIDANAHSKEAKQREVDEAELATKMRKLEIDEIKAATELVLQETSEVRKQRDHLKQLCLKADEKGAEAESDRAEAEAEKIELKNKNGREIKRKS